MEPKPRIQRGALPPYIREQTQLIFTKFKIYIFNLWEQSHWDYVSSSDYKQSLIIKAGHPSTLITPIFLSFSKPSSTMQHSLVVFIIILVAFISLSGGIFLNPSYTRLAYRMHPRRDSLAVGSQRQTTGTLVHLVHLRGGWIYFKDSALSHLSLSLISFQFLIMFFVCVFWASPLFDTLEQHLMREEKHYPS